MNEKDDFKEVIDKNAFKGLETKAAEFKNLLTKITNGKWEVLHQM